MLAHSLHSISRAVAHFEDVHTAFAVEIRRRDAGTAVDEARLYELLRSRAAICTGAGCEVPDASRRALPGQVARLLATVETKGRRALDLLTAASDPIYLADAAAAARARERFAIHELGQAVLQHLAEQGLQGELEQLLQDAAAGDRAAFAQLYDRTIGMVYAAARRVCRSEQETEEVVNDAYLQVWRNAGSYDVTRGPVTAWLRTIVRSRAIDARRRAGAQDRGRLGYELANVELDTAPTAADDFERVEAAAEVRQAIERLPPKQRQIMALAFFRGLGHAEIAATLGIPLGTVKSHIHSGIRKLRRAYQVPESA